MPKSRTAEYLVLKYIEHNLIWFSCCEVFEDYQSQLYHVEDDLFQEAFYCESSLNHELSLMLMRPFCRLGSHMAMSHWKNTRPMMTIVR